MKNVTCHLSFAELQNVQLNKHDMYYQIIYWFVERLFLWQIHVLALYSHMLQISCLIMIDCLNEYSAQAQIEAYAQKCDLV